MEQLNLQIKQIVRECLEEAELTNHKKAIPLEKPNLLSRKEVSQILKVSLVTLNEWEKKKILLPIRIGSRVRYHFADVEKLVVKRKPKIKHDEGNTI